MKFQTPEEYKISKMEDDVIRDDVLQSTQEQVSHHDVIVHMSYS